MSDTKTKKPRRQGNGRGTVRRVGNRWRWEITLGYRSDGRRMTLSGYADTKSEASTALEAALTDRRRQLVADPNTVTVAEFAEKWQRKLSGVRPVTQRRYRQELDYAVEHIGDLRMQAVKTDHIRDLLNELTERRMRRGNLMSPRTRKHVLMHLRRMFEAAIADEIIVRNPVSGLERQTFGLSISAGDALNHRQALRLREVGQALYEADMCRLWPAVLLTVVTGLRRKEIMSLTRENVDLERNRIFVRRNREYADGGFREVDVKNQSSFRSVPIPKWCTEVLRQHLDRQNMERRQAGDAWTDTDALFATRLGGWTHHDNLTRAVSKIVQWSDPASVGHQGKTTIWHGVPQDKRRKLTDVILSGEKLPSISPHDLRHTYATLALRDGQDIAVVSKRMGHSRVSTTLDIYRHVDADELEEAYDIFGEQGD